MENSDKVTCSECSHDIERDDIRDLDGSPVCSDCSVWCEECETLILADNSFSANGGDTVVCEDCGWHCEHCDERYTGYDSFTVYSYGEQTWCRSCYEEDSYYCERCNETYSNSNDYVNVQGDTWCQGCYNDYGYWCDDCDEAYPDGESCNCEGSNGVACRCGRRGSIHSYSCKPDLVFHGFSSKSLYMGFELETEFSRSRSLAEASEYASTQLSTENIAILKDDASISNGFEIVTQPHTHDHYRYKSEKLWETIEKLRSEYGARSWDTETCGLHIHLSRAGFNGGAHTHRWLNFIYKNAQPLMQLAGRKTRYARFNDVWTFDQYDRPVFSLAHKVADPRRSSTERYSAVNTQNQHTLELRFFRGTMNKSGILSALDLAQASVEYTRNLSLSDIKMGALGWDWFTDYVDQNNGLYPDLYSRLPKISGVDINRPVTMEA